MMYRRNIFLGLGSNLRSLSFTNAEKLFNCVIYRINLSGIRVIKASNNWASSPIPFKAGPYFLNKVLKCVYVKRENITPVELFNKLNKVESILGKKKKNKISARLIDIDILDLNGLVYKDKIILPHPRLHLRNFVLNPLYTIQKDWKHPKLKQKIPQLKSKIRTPQKLKEILS